MATKPSLRRNSISEGFISYLKEHNPYHTISEFSNNTGWTRVRLYRIHYGWDKPTEEELQKLAVDLNVQPGELKGKIPQNPIRPFPETKEK